MIRTFIQAVGVRPAIWRNAVSLAAVAAFALGCASPAPAPVRSVSVGAPSTSQTQKSMPASSASAPANSASSSLTLVEWKRHAAERIHAVNRSQVFSGVPPNPLRAVVVVEMTVSADGQVRRADLLRVPGHARELGATALRTVNAASPLPAPPRALVANGSMRITETWLFRNDGQFQLRSLAVAQARP